MGSCPQSLCADRRMNFIMFPIGVLVCLPSVLLGMVLPEDNSVLVNFCCPDGETLRIRSVRDKLRADCVRKRNLENSLEGKEVPVLGRQNCEIVQKELSKIGTKKPDCGRGLMIAPMDFQESFRGIAAPLYSGDFFEPRQFNESTDAVSDGDEGESGICYPIDGSAVYLSTSGKLVQKGQEIGPEEYCLAEHWEHAGSAWKRCFAS